MAPQLMTEEQYVESYKSLPYLNEAYVRARYKLMKGLGNYDEVLRAYSTTEMSKRHVKCTFRFNDKKQKE